jgi:hypothetical protein
LAAQPQEQWALVPERWPVASKALRLGHSLAQLERQLAGWLVQQSAAILAAGRLMLPFRAANKPLTHGWTFHSQHNKPRQSLV